LNTIITFYNVSLSYFLKGIDISVKKVIDFSLAVEMAPRLKISYEIPAISTSHSSILD